MDGALDTTDDLPATQGKRRRASDLHLAFAADEEIEEEDAQRRGPEMRARREANHASAVVGVAAASPARAAEGRSKVSGPAVAEEAEKSRGSSASAAVERKLSARQKSRGFKSVGESTLSQSAAYAGSVLAHNKVEGKQTAEACSVAKGS